MASRFWADNKSEEEEEVRQSNKEGSNEESAAGPSGRATGASRYLEKYASDNDDSDSQHRTVKSTRERRNEEMESTLGQIHNAPKINDWVNLVDCFDKLNKQLEKMSRVNESNKVPTTYIKVLVLLEDFLAETHANNAKGKMSHNNAKAFKSMEHKLKKNNKKYAEVIEKYRAQTVADEGSEDETEDVTDISDDGGDDVIEYPSDEEQEKEEEDENDKDNKRGDWVRNQSKKDKLMDKQFQKNLSEFTWEVVDKKLEGYCCCSG